MELKNTVKQIFCTFAVTLLIVIGINLCVGIRGTELLSVITDKIIFISVLLIVNDFFQKLFKEKEKLVKEYFGGMSIEWAVIFGLIGMRYSSTLMVFVIAAVLFVISGVLLYIYDKKVYDIIDIDLPKANIIEAREWRKLQKSFRKKSKEQISKALESFLRFKVEGDVITGDLCFDSPLDSDNLSTLKELREQNVNSNLIYETDRYINSIVAKMEV